MITYVQDASGNWYTLSVAADGSLTTTPVAAPSPLPLPSQLASNFLDLVDLNSVKGWLGIDLTNTDFDSQIQKLITGFSQWVCHRSGITSFNSVQSYTEVYDGNGNNRIFLDNRPIVSVTSILINNVTLQQSQGIGYAGWFIERGNKSIALRTGGGIPIPNAGFFYPYTFLPGVGNIQITYTAGYTRVPFDLSEAAMKAVAINFSRKDWKDLASKNLGASGATGTTTYRNWILPPEIIEVLNYYKRYARS